MQDYPSLMDSHVIHTKGILEELGITGFDKTQVRQWRLAHQEADFPPLSNQAYLQAMQH